MTNHAHALPRILNGRRFIVPDYQRPYSWEERQLEDLWHDLDLMTERSRHYTGTLVIKELDDELVADSGDTFVSCEVVDGQQRLTTCLLLIHELRTVLVGLNHDLATDRAFNLDTTYGPLVVGGFIQARLQLGEDLNDYWLNVILGDDQQSKQNLTEGEKRLRDAQIFFRKKLADLTSGRDIDQTVEVLQRLQTRLTNGLRFLTYEIEPGSHAGEIFETLNGRGRALTEMEKIKNYLLFLANYAPENSKGLLAAQINQSWSSIYDLLARHNTDEGIVLRAHWLATHHPRAQNWKGAVSVKERFARERYVPGSARLTSRDEEDTNPEAASQLVRDVQSYIKGLERCAMFTAEFQSQDATYQSFNDGAVIAAARASAARLRRTEITAPFLPLVLASRLAHPGDGSFYARLLDACERYAARVFIIGQRRTNSGQSRMYRLAHDLYRGNQTQREVLDAIARLTLEFANDEIVSTGLSATQNWYHRHGHKYFLYEYELAQASRVDDVPKFSTFAQGSKRSRTTEHILPQHPKWDSGDWSAFTHEDHASLVHSIGNLVLTDDNSTYSNHSFARKRGSALAANRCYAKSKLTQERELAELDDWTPAEVEARRQRLANWALDRWHVNRPRPAQADDSSNEDEETDALELEETDNS